MGTAVALTAYQFIYRTQMLLGRDEPNLVQQITTLPPGALIAASSIIGAATLIIGDTYLDSKPYKEVADSQEYHP